MKQKILTLYNENSDIVDEIVSKYSLPSVNENSIASFVKLRNNKTHSGTVEWGGKVQRYIHPCLLSFMLVFLNILNCQMK